MRFLFKFLCLTLLAAVTAIFSSNLPAQEIEDIPQPAPAAQAAQRWIGVSCHSAGEAMRTQLKLPAEQGLIVTSVVPAGPAANAGIRQHDVLLMVGDQNLGTVPDLLRSVEQAGTGAMSIELLRGGERIEVQVTPAERPAAQPDAVVVPGEDRRALREWLDRLEPDANEPLPRRRRLMLRFAHPGLVIEAGAKGQRWPSDLQVSVERDGDEPMKITVRRGEQTWDVSPDQMGNLPELIRPLVEGVLSGRGGAAGAPEPDVAVDIPQATIPGVDIPEVSVPEVSEPEGKAASDGLPPAPTPANGEPTPIPSATPPPEPQPPAAESDESKAELQRRLEDIQRQLEQLQKAVREADEQKKSQ